MPDVREATEVTMATSGNRKVWWKRRTGRSSSYCCVCLEAKGLVDVVAWVSGSEKTAASLKNIHIFLLSSLGCSSGFSWGF